MSRIELHSPADKQLASDLLTRFKTAASYIVVVVLLLMCYCANKVLNSSISYHLQSESDRLWKCNTLFWIVKRHCPHNLKRMHICYYCRVLTAEQDVTRTLEAVQVTFCWDLLSRCLFVWAVLGSALKGRVLLSFIIPVEHKLMKEK